MQLGAMGVKELKARDQSHHNIDADASTAGGAEGRGGEGRVPPPGGRQHPCNLLTTPDQALLVERGLSAEGCLEKTDFVNHVLLAQPGAE